jgi:hypothetical protein
MPSCVGCLCARLCVSVNSWLFFVFVFLSTLDPHLLSSLLS